MSTLPLTAFKRLVIKIGSSLLIARNGAELRTDWLSSLAGDIAALKARGMEIVVVSSGAVLMGRRALGLNARTLSLDKLQAAASVGQIDLNQAWRNALAKHNVTIGQILITPNITEERRYYLNARTTINTLLALGAVPIINENDSVVTSEIRYGDNDRLSARVAVMIEADALVILSDVDGLYTAPPGKSDNMKHIPVVKQVTPEIEAMAGGAASHFSRGGMTTKIEAAKIATMAGTAMFIAKGSDLSPLGALALGGKHTFFAASQTPKAARKRWISGTLEVAGEIHIDAGAATALRNGKSLLPIGVTRIKGAFSRGDAIAIYAPDGEEMARGLASMSFEDANLAKGKKSQAIIGMFGAENRTELVHADDLALSSSGFGETNE